MPLASARASQHKRRAINAKGALRILKAAF
jgi:hypothetical protein